MVGITHRCHLSTRCKISSEPSIVLLFEFWTNVLFVQYNSPAEQIDNLNKDLPVTCNYSDKEYQHMAWLWKKLRQRRVNYDLLWHLHSQVLEVVTTFICRSLKLIDMRNQGLTSQWDSTKFYCSKGQGKTNWIWTISMQWKMRICDKKTREWLCPRSLGVLGFQTLPLLHSPCQKMRFEPLKFLNIVSVFDTQAYLIFGSESRLANFEEKVKEYSGVETLH